MCTESEMSAEEWETNVSGRGAGREAKVQGGRMISWEREHYDTRREEQESQSLVNHHRSLLSHSLYSTVFHLKLLLFVKKKYKNSFLNRFQSHTLFVCPTFHIVPPAILAVILSPHSVSVSVSPTRTEARSRRAFSPSLSLSHLQFALNTLLRPPIPRFLLLLRLLMATTSHNSTKSPSKHAPAS